ncbi:MAG: Bug family tripartite tricarboxylate transporter substrate binding protein [Burkholderiales bacterium]
MRKILLSGIALAAALTPTLSTAAQQQSGGDYPNRPVRLIVTFAPGASNDILARLIGAKLTDAWGQNIIVDNRAGAGGTIGAGTVARAGPDGHTLLLANSGPSVGAPLLSKTPSYSPHEFSNIVYIGFAPLVILANLSFAPRTPKELVEYAKANPGKISWGSSGTGTSPHIAILLFQAATGTSVTHIPYKGAAPNMADLLARQIDVIYTTTVSSEPQIKANRVRGIGVASAKRVRLLPEVPTLSEFGIRNAEAQIWYGLQGPQKMPAGTVDKINAEVNKALQMPDVRARLDQLGFEIAGGSPKAFDAVVKGEIARIEKLLKAGLLQKTD